MSTETHLKSLYELAEYVGIQTYYENIHKERIDAKPESLLQVLNLLGFKIQAPKQASEVLKQIIINQINNRIDEVSVFWDGQAASIRILLYPDELKETLSYELVDEQQQIRVKKKINLVRYKEKKRELVGITYFEKSIKIPQLPTGYFHFKVSFKGRDYRSFFLSAPTKMYTENLASKGKIFGLFAPIYALHDATTQGCGDLATFNIFAKWVAKQGGDVVATLPFFAAFLNEPCEPSPYSPVSRLYWNELYLNLKKMGIKVSKKLDNKEELIDYKKVAAWKRELLEQQLNNIHSNEALQIYIANNPEVQNYALFRSHQELTKKPWTLWTPEEHKTQLHANKQMEKSYWYHLWVQWQFTLQLKQLKQKLNARGQLLYLDLPVGVHKDGFDAWRYQNEFVIGASIGAPPDPVFKQGQNWSLPPLHPMAIRTANYEYLITMLRRILPFINILRIDHVMGLNRMYWIPEYCSSEEGIYVNYPANEIYAILSIESHRHKTAIIGENLGTVPPDTNQLMKKHNMLQMNILQYDLDSNKSQLTQLQWMLTNLNTHDMPTFFAYCQALDIEEKKKKHQLTETEAIIALEARKKCISILKKNLRDNHLDEHQLLESSLKLMAASDAQILMINIEDLWCEPYAQNLPASDASVPNWKRRFRYSLEQFKHMPEINKIINEVNKIRQQKNLPQAASHNLISKEDIYLFNEGTHYRLYNHLGAHLLIKDGKEGVNFAVWAPNARYVSVIGNFNYWDKQEHPMFMVESSGIWELFIPGITTGYLYKFYIESHYNDFKCERADPFAFYQEQAPHTASIIWDSKYQWQDEQWMGKRGQLQQIDTPISIYEVHLGSWRRVPEEQHRFLSYREMAPLLAKYVTEMNFTHVEFLPIMEHPFYGSWGYQTLGYFTPTSRYGSPDDFKYLIDCLHQHNIAVILDWVPSHFPNDLHGLAYFDGTHLYEHADPQKGFHPDWKSAIFNYGRHEVRSFLISSAQFWLDHYHIDGLRVDAVASMLYLDYSRSEGEWMPNIKGGNENIEAIEFLKNLNETLYKNYPDIQTFAEESTAWPGVSRPTYLGGLGFGFKWDMGWMHDTLAYLGHDPVHRCYHHNQLTFRMVYAFSENFTLPLSHDEVVYGKGSLLNKMPGDLWAQCANLRLLYGYMYAMPSKKLMFMGCEIGQASEWNHEHSCDWHLVKNPLNAGMQKWVQHLNFVYRSEPALHQLDCDPLGFEWIDTQDSQNSIFLFLRKSINNQFILVIVNCTPVTRINYRVGVPMPGLWRLISSSDAIDYGGTGKQENQLISEEITFHHRLHSVTLTLPPLSVLYYKWTEQ